MASGSQLNLSGGVELGWNGGTGTASVTGQGTSVNVAANVVVGHDLNAGGTTTGTLTVADSATLTAAALFVGAGNGGIGTLNIGTGGNAGVINAPIFMGGQSSTINFDHNQSNYVFSSVIADNAGGAPTTGSVNFLGTGTTIFTNTNTYTSATNINAGELQIAAGGSIANSVLTTVNSGGTLSGAGTAGDVAVKSGGTITPTGFNALTVKDIAFDSGSTFKVGINTAGKNGSIAANTATINGGTVSVMAGSGNYVPGTSYTILTTTGGRTGQFDGLVNTDFTFLKASLGYTADDVDLTLARNLTTFASVANTPNQRAVATSIDGLLSNNPVYGAIVQQNTAGAQQAYDALSGEVHASAQGVLIANSLAVGDMINNRLTQSFDGTNSFGSPNTAVTSFAPEDSNASLNYAEGDKSAAKAPWPMARKAPVPVTPAIVYSMWAQGFGSWLSRDGDGNAAGLKSSTDGILSGIDVTWMGAYRFGVAGGYNRSDITVSARSSSLDADSYHISAYGGVRQYNFGLNAGVVYSWNDISSDRLAAFPGVMQTLLANYSAATTQMFGEANYQFLLGRTVAQAFVGLNYIDHRTDAFNETGGFAALAVNGSERDLTFSTVGLRTSAVLGEYNAMTVVGRGTVGWRHAFGDIDTAMLAAFAGGAPFQVTGTPIATDQVLGEAGLDLNINPNWTVGASWSGQFGEKANENRLNGKLVYRW
jgi:outer membrane autotransporter protein